MIVRSILFRRASFRSWSSRGSAGGAVFGLHDLPEPQGVVGDGKAVCRREDQPGEHVVEGREAERAAMPAGLRPTRSAPGYPKLRAVSSWPWVRRWAIT
jgi:hypothetical protein